jgi:ABC-type cobalamin/Fe3+-siderophores transport system ATPase subunit
MTNIVNQIHLLNISFSYNRKIPFLIENLSIDIPLKESTVLLGLNGAGKTTLLLLLLGYLKPTSGKVQISENSVLRDIGDLNGRVGYLSQTENIPFEFIVREFILLGRAPHILRFQTPSKKDYEICDQLIETLELAYIKERKLGEISGGELQRVRIARTLAQEPEVILMDEPMTHLDIKNKKYLNELISELKKTGKTIIYSSHDPLDALNYSDNCIIVGKNNQYLAGKTAEVITSETLSRFFELSIEVINEMQSKSISVN